MKLIQGRAYWFADNYNEDSFYVFEDGDEMSATFTEYRHDPFDGTDREVGEIELNAYQISKLHPYDTDTEGMGNEMKIYYILRDLDGYGSEYPVCVDLTEAERLMKEWYNTDDAPNFDSVWAEATEEDIAKYARYDSDED